MTLLEIMNITCSCQKQTAVLDGSQWKEHLGGCTDGYRSDPALCSVFSFDAVD